MTGAGIKLSDADKLRLAKLRKRTVFGNLGTLSKKLCKPLTSITSFSSGSKNKQIEPVVEPEPVPVVEEQVELPEQQYEQAAAVEESQPAVPVPVLSQQPPPPPPPVMAALPRLNLTAVPPAPPVPVVMAPPVQEVAVPEPEPEPVQEPAAVEPATNESGDIELTREQCFCAMMDILLDGMSRADKPSKDAAKYLMLVMENEVGDSVSLLVYNSYVRMYNSLRQQYFLSSAANLKAKTIKISADIIESLEQMSKTVKIELAAPFTTTPRRATS